MKKNSDYRVKVTVGDATVEVEGAEAGVVKIVEAISSLLRASQKAPAPSGGGLPQSMTPTPRGTLVDLRTFFQQKAPSSDVEATAVAAYYYQYLAPEKERRDAIDSETLQDAFRLAKWPLPRRTTYTLVNTRNAGYMDSLGEGGLYRLNAVGYNLVEHTLGRKSTTEEPARKRPRSKTQKRRPRSKTQKRRPSS